MVGKVIRKPLPAAQAALFAKLTGATFTGDIGVTSAIPRFLLTDTDNSAISLLSGNGGLLTFHADATNKLAASMMQFYFAGAEAMRLTEGGGLKIGAVTDQGAGTIITQGPAYAPAWCTTTSVTLADDAATSFTIPGAGQQVMVAVGLTDDYGGIGGLRGGATANFGRKWNSSGGSLLDFTTGSLSGTTGTDTHVTVSAHTDNKLYIENRSGITRTPYLWIFGR